MSDDSPNHQKALIYMALAGMGIYVGYKFLEKSSGNTPVIPITPINAPPPVNTPIVPINPPPPVNTPIITPPITPTPPPTGVVGTFSRGAIINNLVGYLFGAPNAFAALSSAANFPSLDNINSNGYDTAQLSFGPVSPLAFGPWPGTGYYYMPKVNVSVMIGFPMLSVPASYPPMGSFVNGVPFISPPDGALVGWINYPATGVAPYVYGGQYYKAWVVQGAVPMTGFGTTLGLWARFSVVGWGIISVSPVANPNTPPWILNSDSGTQVVWA